MTVGWVGWPNVGQTITTIRPMGWGSVGMTDFVKDCIDEGAPEINVNGVAGIEPISDGQLRIAYFRCRKGERVTVAYLVWDKRQWLAMWNTWEVNRDALIKECFDVQALAAEHSEMN